MDALKAARKVLSARIGDPKVKFVPGLADDLRAILGAFDEVDRRTSVLAAVVLKKHYWPGLSIPSAELNELERMGAKPATVARAAQHGHRCSCSECIGGKHG